MLIGGAGPAAAAVCANSSEREALDTRVLQTELVVAALSCGENQRYKAFVGRFENELIKRAGVMKKYFQRSHGGRANKEMNQFVTSLANEASQRSLAESATFCAGATKLFEDLMKVEPKELVKFASARPTAATHDVPLCGQAKREPVTVQASATAPKPAAPTRTAAAAPRSQPVAAGAPKPEPKPKQDATRTAATKPPQQPEAAKESGS